MVPGKLGLSDTKVKVLVGRALEWLLRGALSATVSLPLPMASMCAGTVTLMVEVKRLMPYPFTGNQRPA